MTGVTPMTPTASGEELLAFTDVSKVFDASGGRRVAALDAVSLRVCRGETLAIVGESGSGKSTMLRLALGLITPTSGTVTFRGASWRELGRAARSAQRGRIGTVFQEPLESLDPRQRVRSIVSEPLRLHRRDMPRPERDAAVDRALAEVGLGTGFADKLPRQLSGGQQQRVGLARAVIGRPDLILLDEPTSALDVSVQAQILDLLGRLRAELGAGFVLVTHDLDVASYLADRLMVMRHGRVVEAGSVDEVFSHPSSPYTRELLEGRLADEVPGDLPAPIYQEGRQV
jgi:ABC-type glutathione transport system ATPase component